MLMLFLLQFSLASIDSKTFHKRQEEIGGAGVVMNSCGSCQRIEETKKIPSRRPRLGTCSSGVCFTLVEASCAKGLSVQHNGSRCLQQHH